MRYEDIITERELNEGPLDWIKQKAGQAADWAADKLGYAPKADAPAPAPASSSGGQKSRPLQMTGGSTTPSDVRRRQVDKRIAKARARQAGYRGGAAGGTSTNTF